MGFFTTYGLIGIAIVVFSSAASTGMLLWIINNMNHSVVRGTQVHPLVIVAVGGIFLSLSQLTLFPTPTYALCLSRMWLTSLWATLQLAALTVKVLRVYTVFIDRQRRIDLSLKRTVFLVAPFLLPDLMILVIATALKGVSIQNVPLTITDTTTEKISACAVQYPFIIPLVGYKLLLIGSNLFLAYKTRSTLQRFAEVSQPRLLRSADSHRLLRRRSPSPPRTSSLLSLR
jgi:hypothetical protein